MNYKTLSIDSLSSTFNAERIFSNIETFSKFTLNKTGGVTRPAFSEKDLLARKEIISMMQSELKLKTRIDSFGNIIGLREGNKSSLPIIATGSHIDSVVNGGKFDGPAGVFCAFEAFRVMNALQIVTNHPFEIIVFTSEEPNSFGISTVGSRGVAGLLQKSDLENLKDDSGNDFSTALSSIGGDLEHIQNAVRKPQEIKHFVELHIEQTPYLYHSNKDIGVVIGSTGIQRSNITVIGRSGHTGTTLMENRKDSLFVAAHLITAIENAVSQTDGKAVASVGHFSVLPNALNVIPNYVNMCVEIRSYYPKVLDQISHKFANLIKALEKKYNIEIKEDILYKVQPIKFSRTVIDTITQAADLLNLDRMDIISMAGHDAVHMSKITKSGMIFIPSKDGVSHCAEEWTEPNDLLKGAQCLLQTLLILDSQ